MLGIIIGVASVIAMLAIGQGSKQSIQETISEMGSNMLMVQPGSQMRGGVKMGRSTSQTLKLKDVKAIQEKSEYIGAVSPVVTGGGQVIYGSKNWPTSVQGGSTDYFEIKKLEVINGDYFTDKDVKSAAKVCLLGQTVVENLFEEGEDPVGKTIRFNKIPFKVIGVLEEKGENTFGQDQDDVMIAPYTTVQKRILAITHIQSIYTSAINEESVEPGMEELEGILRLEHKLKDADENDFHVRSQQELITTFSSTSELLTVLLATIAGISLIVGGIGIMNIMYVSVTERTREIGLRMAVGGRSVDIMFQFLIEAVLISISGGIIGLCLGLGSSYIVSNVLGWPTVVTSFSVILSFVVCSITGIFFGWYPALKASQLDPIDALRYE